MVDEIWQLSGHIAIADLPPAGLGFGSTATARLSGLVAHKGGQEILTLNEMAISNDAWGCFAG